MNAYYLTGLITSALLCICFFLWICFSLNVNWSRRNKIGISFLLPVLLSLLFIGGIIFEFRPRLLDVFNIASDNVLTLTAETGDFYVKREKLYYGDRVLTLNPSQKGIDPTRSYRVTYTPGSLLVLKIEELDEPDDNPEVEPISNAH